MKHSLDLCQTGLHIREGSKSSSQFDCKCCGYIFESLTCPSCGGMDLVQISSEEVQCQRKLCGTQFFAKLELNIPSSTPEQETSELQEKIFGNYEEDKHEHEKGFRKGLINRDYQ